MKSYLAFFTRWFSTSGYICWNNSQSTISGRLEQISVKQLLSNDVLFMWWFILNLEKSCKEGRCSNNRIGLVLDRKQYFAGHKSKTKYIKSWVAFSLKKRVKTKYWNETYEIFGFLIGAHVKSTGAEIKWILVVAVRFAPAVV